MLKSFKSAIIFFIPPEELVSGGILSIFSLCKESRSIVSSDTLVAVSTYPGTSSYKKNTLFKNDETILDFTEIIRLLPSLDSLILHIPEYAINRVTFSLMEYSKILKAVTNLHINILNQNMELMPSAIDVASLWSLSPRIITQTTAHLRYTTQDVADIYNTPVLNFSVFLDPRQYELKDFSKKENIIAYSNDKHPLKEHILSKLKRALPSYSLVEINHLSYEQYKELIGKAKFILTFGEGFDGYYIEGIFSGSITFAVYNDIFFESKDFLKYKNIFASYDKIERQLVDTINELDNEKVYTRTNLENFNKLSKIYDLSIYRQNIKKFYNEDFSFYPTHLANTIFFANAIYERDSSLHAHDKLIYEKDLAIQTYSRELKVANQKISDLNNDVVNLTTTIKEQNLFISMIKNNIFYRILKNVKSTGRKIKRRILS